MNTHRDSHSASPNGGRGPTTVVTPTHGIDFALTPQDALEKVYASYRGLLFGLRKGSLVLQEPSREYFPFYLCRGRVTGSYKATVQCESEKVEEEWATTEAVPPDHSFLSHTKATAGPPQQQPSEAAATLSCKPSASPASTGTKNVRVKRVRTTHRTASRPLLVHFTEMANQVFAGDAAHPNTICESLMHEPNAVLMRRASELSMMDPHTTVHDFALSTREVKRLISKNVVRQARQHAEKQAAADFANVSTAQVVFDEKLCIYVEQIVPVLVPCYVIKGTYMNEPYVFYVNGALGTVTGPSLLYAPAVGLLCGLVVAGIGILCEVGVAEYLTAGTVAGLISYAAAVKAPAMVYGGSDANGKSARQQQQRREKLWAIPGFRPSLTSAATVVEDVV